MRKLSECTILVVDDTEANVDILLETLGEDYDVTVAMSGEEALESLAGGMPDLILLDIMMPGIDGYEVCRRLKADCKTWSIPVVFITAMGQVEDETRGLELGAVDYITKPISPSIVKARVKNHLELKLAREDLEKQNEVLQENVRLREEIERINRHDLKTPLNSIISLSRILLQDGCFALDHLEMLKIIEKSGYIILNMINLSLDLAKMEKRIYQLQPVSLDLLSVIRKIIFDLHSMADAKTIKFNVLKDGRLIDDKAVFGVLGEELLCYSLFANLIKNAVEASPANETITIRLSMEETSRCQICIHNQGTVPASIRDKFFEKYSTAGKKGGTGIGTYSAKLMTETLGGNISMTTGETSGTTITVILERATVNTDSLSPATETVDSQSKSPYGTDGLDELPPLEVLIVDDDEYNRLILSRYLKHTRLNISLADNGQTAIEKFTRGNFDIIFLDMEMPVLNGSDTALYIRQQENIEPAKQKAVILVAISGHDDAQTRRRCLDIGFNAYLSKPVNARQLWQTLLSFFTNKSSTQPQIEKSDRKSLSDKANEDIYQVEVDTDIEDLISTFLSEKKEEIRKAAEMLSKSDFEGVQKLGHKLKGGFNMYGFERIGKICAAIEEAAKKKDPHSIKNNMDILIACLGTMQISFTKVD